MIVDLLRNDLGRVCEPGTHSRCATLVGAAECYRQVAPLTSGGGGPAPLRRRPWWICCGPAGRGARFSGAPKNCGPANALGRNRARGPRPLLRLPVPAGAGLAASTATSVIRSLMLHRPAPAGAPRRLAASSADSDPAARPKELGWKLRARLARRPWDEGDRLDRKQPNDASLPCTGPGPGGGNGDQPESLNLGPFADRALQLWPMELFGKPVCAKAASPIL